MCYDIVVMICFVVVFVLFVLFEEKGMKKQVRKDERRGRQWGEIRKARHIKSSANCCGGDRELLHVGLCKGWLIVCPSVNAS